MAVGSVVEQQAKMPPRATPSQHLFDGKATMFVQLIRRDGDDVYSQLPPALWSLVSGYGEYMIPVFWRQFTD
jgi:hypothetical protein